MASERGPIVELSTVNCRLLTGAYRLSSFVLLGTVILSGCTSPIRQYGLTNLTMSCDEANRLTYETLTNLGFTVSAFTPAKMGQPGEAKGTREATQGLPAQKVTVSIDCHPAGTAVDAREDGKLLGQLEFRRSFYISFTAAQAMEARRIEMAEKVAAGKAAPPPPSRTLQVLIEPVRGQAAKLDFEIDLAAAGVLPVRIHIRNPTDRGYDLTPGDIQVSGRDRTRVAPLPTAAAAARVVNAQLAGNGAPVTTMSAGAVAQLLDDKRLTATRVEPGSEVEGYLYFPLGDYVRARVVLTEEGSDGTEGFVVEF